MKTWATFLDYVQPWVSGASQPMAEHAIKLAAIEFMQVSRCDRRTLAAVSTVADSSAAIALTLPAETEIVRIESVRLQDGEFLDPLETNITDTTLVNESGEPKYYQRDASNSKLIVLPRADAVYSLVTRVSLKPTLAGTGVDNDNIANRYAEAIGWGAIHRLLSIPSKPWSDMGAASLYMSKAKMAQQDALSDADLGDTSAPQRTRSVFGLR